MEPVTFKMIKIVTFKGSFNNYVDKKRVVGEGVSRKSTIGQVTKGRYHVKYPQFSLEGGGGSKLSQNWCM